MGFPDDVQPQHSTGNVDTQRCLSLTVSLCLLHVPDQDESWTHTTIIMPASPLNGGMIPHYEYMINECCSFLCCFIGFFV